MSDIVRYAVEKAHRTGEYRAEQHEHQIYGHPHLNVERRVDDEFDYQKGQERGDVRHEKFKKLHSARILPHRVIRVEEQQHGDDHDNGNRSHQKLILGISERLVQSEKHDSPSKPI